MTCWYCGCELRPAYKTVDHVRPISRGGNAADPGNKVDACKNCNSEKKDMTIDEYRLYVELVRNGCPYTIGTDVVKFFLRAIEEKSPFTIRPVRFHGEIEVLKQK